MLGRLPSHVDRQTWRQLLLETGDITSLMDQDVVVKGPQGQADIIWTRDELPRLTEIQKLSVAFLQLVQCISLKFLQKTLQRYEAGRKCAKHHYGNTSVFTMAKGFVTM
ncbi:hypothetical protein KIN20_033682 [Parelaphostrongylus tenuis]|uniref:Uncharacterized protein n=1 Tax=Parelaphostrongylus tenuis TaxID=148309 RepID=A0AAD5R8G6_PARTN|nr:hypothetical protein KIN20_033682 [Parelaphostrongylus tenuis]